MFENGRDAFIDISYLVSAILLIVGLIQLSTPKTARTGNLLAGAGMGLAVLVTLFSDQISQNYILIVLAIIIGALPGYYASQKVQMTAMPQMIAAFNGFGGAASALIAVAEFLGPNDPGRGTVTTIALGCVIGSLAATGSAVAFAKLQGLIPAKPIVLGNRTAIAGGVLGAVAILTILVIVLASGTLAEILLVLLFLVALAAGVLLVIPIGGADMPVVIAMLNAFTGVAAILTGFVLDIQLLIVGGTLVGASGMYLSMLMAKAMNRSITNVLFGAFGAAPGGGGPAAGDGEQKPINETNVEDAAVSLAYASRVIVVPGYGLAVAQAQHAVQELAHELQERGVDVRYAIHPVAGRMPGHMNVLLAEANVPYDDLYEMDEINDDFSKTDAVLVIGANDVTNPAARDDPNSPIYGMPILRVDEADRVIVLKRGMSPGFSGVENELFHNPKTSMLFGDAKDTLGQLVGEVRDA